MRVSTSCRVISSTCQRSSAARSRHPTACRTPDSVAGVTRIAIHYAAYGSNLHPVRLGERLPSARLLGTGFVAGEELCFHKRSVDLSGKCSIRPGGSGVHVAVYEISAADKLRLDAIEGVGRGYSDDVVDVPGFSSCAAYRAESTFVDERLLPYDWYRELVLLGCRFHGFPAPYIARIAGCNSQVDADVKRRERNWRLIDRIRDNGW